MNELPPSIDFNLSTEEEQGTIKRLALDINPGSITRAAREWKHPSLIKASRGTHTFYPHFRHILDLYASDPQKYADPGSGLRFDETLKYRLVEDLYKEGLYDPAPANHRLHGLIDFLYFPDHIRVLCDKADQLACREVGTCFDDLIKLWQLMSLSVDDTLYRHSTAAYGMYAPLWHDVNLRYKIGIKLIKIAIFYGDYELARKLIKFLRDQRGSLAAGSDVKHYTDLLRLLELNSQAHLHEIDAYATDISKYKELYLAACGRNDDVAASSAPEQKRHVKLLRAICVGGCRHSVRHVMRVLGTNGAMIDRYALAIADYLAGQLKEPDVNVKRIDHAKLPKTNHDWDTLARTASVVLVEHAKANGEANRTQDLIRYAKDCHKESTLVRRQRRRKDDDFLKDVVGRPELAKWVANVDLERIHLGTLFLFWEQVTSALIDLQYGRDPLVGSVRKDYLDKVIEALQKVRESKHSAKVKHSRHMLPSIQAVANAELLKI